jgi:predicted DNA-binding transcriptional regulator AlpA
MIRLGELPKIVGLTKKEVLELIRSNNFPEPNVKGKYPVWNEREVDRWMLGIWKR